MGPTSGQRLGARNRTAKASSRLPLQIRLTGQPLLPLILADKVAYFLTDTDSELCLRLNIPYRHVCYTLQEQILPEGSSPNQPGVFTTTSLAQGSWSGSVLLLKRSGIKTPLAGQSAAFVQEGIRGSGANLHWDLTRLAQRLG
jgi:hypothetical protein